MRIERRTSDPADAPGLAASLRAASPDPPGLGPAVAETIERVRRDGDAALVDLGERFDGFAARSIRVDPEEIARADASIPQALREAIELSAANVEAVARVQEGSVVTTVLEQGQRVVVADVAVGAAGVYVPGGRAPYPSSVIMGVVPARIAGVGRVVVASPPGQSGLPADVILAAASIAGADEVYAVGGAQAIAALAYGTETIAAVDVIAGPGSRWVQEAKLQCARIVGIDGYAGPSELVVVCDSSAPAEWVALDICAQAEHGGDGLLVVATPDSRHLDRIGESIASLSSARPSVGDAVAHLVDVDDIAEGVALAQALAPEHLELACAGATELTADLTTPGCIFVGAGSATAFGDYAAGSNHVLPTGGAGRFTGPLGPGTFRRRISRVEIGSDASGRLAGAVDEIARAEGFPVHGESALARRNDPEKGE